MVLPYQYILFLQLCKTGLSTFHKHVQKMDTFSLLMHLYISYFLMISVEERCSLHSQMQTVKRQSSMSRIILEEINVVDGRKRVMV